jgi:ribonucleoside-diphosphate reductase alpha chain
MSYAGDTARPATPAARSEAAAGEDDDDGAAEPHAGNGKGSAEARGGDGGGSAEPRAATSALTDSPPPHPAVSKGLDLGPACQQCGGMMQRTGSCYTCSSCGFNTGCG